VYISTDPIARANGNAWSPAIDRNSQLLWQQSIAQNLSITTPFVSAGVFLQPPKYAIADLAPAEKTAGQTGLVQSYADHAYPQSACGGSTTNLQFLQSHTNIVNFVKGFAPEIAAARAQGIDHVFGETNSGKLVTFVITFCDVCRLMITLTPVRQLLVEVEESPQREIRRYMVSILDITFSSLLQSRS
jgi:hypothetical protein